MSAKFPRGKFATHKIARRIYLDDAATEFKDTYVCMTPELEIIAMTTERRDLHKAGGRAIPGYRQMLGDTPEEE